MITVIAKLINAANENITQYGLTLCNQRKTCQMIAIQLHDISPSTFKAANMLRAMAHVLPSCKAYVLKKKNCNTKLPRVIGSSHKLAIFSTLNMKPSKKERCMYIACMDSTWNLIIKRTCKMVILQKGYNTWYKASVVQFIKDWKCLPFSVLVDVLYKEKQIQT
eukprot:TRINITY_DN88322_c0_g1_i1.p5 TRINITY_DN88322_c0_g1~~TRINITY_DN88322_c0_g1_i1.p5  ORF type:complete len:164 (+),score=1.05 TRINITY_DN88322_c0_g1_i1:1020-1511(+)